jgi:PST family polysaccharide transporter
MTAHATAASLKTRAVSGVRWTMINAVGERVLSFGTTMVLARILDPKHFGLYALAFVAIDSFSVFKNLGLDVAVIQRRDRTEDAATTALWVLPFVGLALYGVLFALAPTLSAWLGHPEVAGPMRVLGAVLIFAGFSSVPLALVRKTLQLDIQAKSNLAGMAVYSAVAIVLAARGWYIWSLVVAYLARWLVAVPLQWTLLRWRPQGRFDWSLLKEMFRYGKYVVGAWTVAFLTANVDKIVIGRWIGAGQLGYYTLCYGLAMFATYQISTRIFHVAFPAFTAAQARPELLRQGFIKLTKYLLFISLPVALILWLVPQELLYACYGKRWMKAAPILQVLAAAGALEALRVGVEPVLLGCGRSRAIFLLNLLQLALLATGATVAALVLKSTVGVAWALIASIGIPCAIGLSLAMRQAGVRSLELLRALRPVGVGLLVMGSVVALVQLVRPGLRMGFGELLSVRGAWLIGASCLGGLGYLMSVARLDPSMIRDLLRLAGLAGPETSGWPKTILFVESGSGYGGSATCLANFLQWMDRTRFRPVVAHHADGVGIERIRQLGVPMVRLRPHGRLWQLVRLIRRERVALVHHNNDIDSAMPTIAAAFMTCTPCVCSLRAARGLTKRERIWVPLVRRFIAVSDAARQASVRSGIPPARIQTVFDGIDVEHYAPGGNGVAPAGLTLDPSRLTVGIVSRLLPEKGIAEFLQAARRVADAFPGVQFVIVGGDPSADGRHFTAWRALADRLSLNNHVIFTGWRGDVDVLTRQFDIAAQASKYWEGWGMSLLEAMACGKPVVGTRIGGVSEVVDDGINGLLVEPGDVGALANALLTLLKDPALRARMGEAGRARAEQRFDQRRQVPEAERIYQGMLEREVVG